MEKTLMHKISWSVFEDIGLQIGNWICHNEYMKICEKATGPIATKFHIESPCA